jgi:hypothetical protein
MRLGPVFGWVVFVSCLCDSETYVTQFWPLLSRSWCRQNYTFVCILIALLVSPNADLTYHSATLAQWIQANLSEFIHGGLLAYFYCDFRKSESKDPVNIIGSLVAQLATQLNIFPDELEQAYEQSLSSNGQHTRPTVSILCTALETLAGTRRLILLVDALDECQSPGDLSQTLKSLASTKGNINVFVTSRDEPDISQVLSGSRRISLESHSSEISEDIRSYIGSRLQSENGLLWLSPSVKVDVQSSLNRGSGGM